MINYLENLIILFTIMSAFVMMISSIGYFLCLVVTDEFTSKLLQLLDNKYYKFFFISCTLFFILIPKDENLKLFLKWLVEAL